LKIYLAHPISGLSADEVYEYYDKAVRELKDNFEILYPMLGKRYLRNEIKFKAEGYQNPVNTNHAIKERDKWMIQESDIVFIDFTGSKIVSMGCCMELAWADLLGKHTIVVLEKGNIHRHAFILDSADIVFETYDEAIEYLKEFKENSQTQ
jgi:nucleoside 2-deoxyribosyltransferase